MDKKLKVLIVEDEELIAIRLVEELTRLGHTVIGPVVTGEEAVQRAEQEQPDVILMDIRLAGETDGLEAAQRIRTGSNAPIIFTTAYPDERLQEETARLQPAVYIVKPILNYEMRMAIKLMMDRSG
jgi:CheY-like chemotaxis protein